MWKCLEKNLLKISASRGLWGPLPGKRSAGNSGLVLRKEESRHQIEVHWEAKSATHLSRERQLRFRLASLLLPPRSLLDQPGTSQILLKERERPCLSSRPTNRALDLTIAFDRPRRKSGWSPILPAVAQNKPTVDRLLKSDLEIAFQGSSGFHTHIFS